MERRNLAIGCPSRSRKLVHASCPFDGTTKHNREHRRDDHASRHAVCHASSGPKPVIRLVYNHRKRVLSVSGHGSFELFERGPSRPEDPSFSRGRRERSCTMIEIPRFERQVLRPALRPPQTLLDPEARRALGVALRSTGGRALRCHRPDQLASRGPSRLPRGRRIATRRWLRDSGNGSGHPGNSVATTRLLDTPPGTLGASGGGGRQERRSNGVPVSSCLRKGKREIAGQADCVPTGRIRSPLFRYLKVEHPTASTGAF
jgi:hypothetical protein